jgi:hypothetical protein
MLQSLKSVAWASCIVCVGLVGLSAGSALAQQEEQQSSNQASSQNDEQEQERQRQARRRQEQERQERQRNEQDNQDEDDDQDRQRDQQDRDRNQRDRERNEQTRDRDDQDRQRDDQAWQRERQARERSEQGRERSVQVDRQDGSRIRAQGERSRFPEPNRDGQFSRQQIGQDRQFSSDGQISRDGQISGEAQRSGQFGQQSEIYTERQSRQFESGGNRDAGLGVNIVSEGGQGITVVRVFQGTPAERMGIREGDRITEVNGQQVQSTQEFISQIRNMSPGDQVQLQVDRNREQIMVSGELESRQEALARNQGGPQIGTQIGPQGGQWRQEDDTWQTGYAERDQNQQQGRIARGGDPDSRIQQIEQQVNRISQQLDQLRASLRQLRQDSQFTRGGERQAGYDDYQGGYQDERIGTRQSEQQDQWDGQGIQRSGRIIDDRSGRIIDDRGGRIIEQRGGPIIDERGTRSIDSGQGTIQSEGFQRGNPNRGEGSFRSDEGGSDSPGGVTGGLRTRPDNDPNWERRQ